MDPWLEHPADWPGFHHLLISASAGLLNQQLKPLGYYVKVDERIWLEEPATTVRPDLAIVEHPSERRTVATVVAADEPLTIRVLPAEITEAFLEVYDAKGRHLVTGIECISPSNKARGRGRNSYRRKRREWKKAGVNLVEIDLLRAGRHLADVPKGALAAVGHWDYLVNVSRARRSEREVYPIPLRQRLPRIRIPLKPTDDDAVLDLQSALDEAYDKGPYSGSIDYNLDPTPPLTPDDSEWANSILRQKGLRK
jgi:Protein of unknown function (DUF4058)